MLRAVVDTSPVQRFVTALVEHDFDALQRTLAGNVQFRALVPPGFRERVTAESARELVQDWFGDAEIFDVEYSTVEPLSECVHAGYRVRVRENGEWFLCEEHLFAHIADNAIDRVDLLCSGFHRCEASTSSAILRQAQDDTGPTHLKRRFYRDEIASSRLD
jgi:hypothetical protein